MSCKGFLYNWQREKAYAFESDERAKPKMMKKTDKYKLMDEFIEVQGSKAYRIVALRDFDDVHAGDVGGYVRSVDNLSQVGNCWIYDSAVACGHSVVMDDARLRGKAFVCDHAVICGNAQVRNCASVMGNAVVCNRAVVDQAALIKDNAVVAGMASITGRAVVMDNGVVGGDAGVTEGVTIADNGMVCGYKYHEGLDMIGNRDGTVTRRTYPSKTHMAKKLEELLKKNGELPEEGDTQNV